MKINNKLNIKLINMRLKMSRNILFTIHMLLFFGIIVSSCDNPRPEDDPSGNLKLVGSARALSYGCPDFFYPPNPPVSRPAGFADIKTQRGSAAWTSLTYLSDYDVIDKKQYIDRLINASINDPSSYVEYLQTTNAGFPGYWNFNTNEFFPDIEYHNGYICYSFVYRASKDAGISMSIPANVDDVVGNMRMLSQIEIDEGYVYAGDIICYDFDPTKQGYEHIGIITRPSGTITNSLVISSIGIIEHFNYGVYEHELEIFGTSPRGEFSSWNPAWQNYTWDIYVNN